MRKDIDHLRPPQQRQLERAVTILREQFAEAIRNKDWGHRKAGRILKIILYGSMARGKPVRDLGTGYRSDFDLLVIVSHPELADDQWWYGAEDALAFEESLGATRYPYHLTVHDIDDVNDQLRRGRPFFVDINRDGIIVYEFDVKELARPGNLSEAEKLEEARAHFAQWFPKIGGAIQGSNRFREDGNPNDAAFMLHQAVERAYHCVLLVLTLYTPKLHKIDKLRAMAEGIEPRLIEAWPRKTREQRRPFDRIRRAYVEARYSPHYKIKDEDLAAAAASVARLQAIVKAVCEERLEAQLGSP